MYLRLLTLIRELEPNRHFLKLWGSQLLSLVAFNMVNFMLLIRVYDLTRSSTAVSFFVLSFGLPALIFGAVAGVFADRWNRRTTLITTNVLRAIVVLGYLVAFDSWVTILIITAIISTITQFFAPAEGALIPELVERRRLVAANAIFMVTMFGSFVIGYGIAGPLSAVGGDSLPIILAAIMFAAATLFCWRLPRRQDRGEVVAIRQAYAGVFSQLKEGLRLLRGNAEVQYGLWQLTFVWATIGVVMVVLPAFTADVLGLNLREVSRLIIIPIGIGMLCGGYILHRARRQFRVRGIVFVSLLLAGLSVIALGQLSNVTGWLAEQSLDLGLSSTALQQLVTSLASTLLGVTLSIAMIASQTLIHEFAAVEARGRVFGVLGMTVNAANTLPVLLAGALTDLVSVSVVVTTVGTMLLLWAIVSRLVIAKRLAVDTPQSGS
jgi:MFS family permease